MLMANTQYYVAVKPNDRVQFETAIFLQDVLHTAQIVKQDAPTGGYLVVVYRGDKLRTTTRTAHLEQHSTYDEAYSKLHDLITWVRVGGELKAFVLDSDVGQGRIFSVTYYNLKHAFSMYDRMLARGADMYHTYQRVNHSRKGDYRKVDFDVRSKKGFINALNCAAHNLWQTEPYSLGKEGKL